MVSYGPSARALGGAPLHRACWNGRTCRWHARGCCLFAHEVNAQQEHSDDCLNDVAVPRCQHVKPGIELVAMQRLVQQLRATIAALLARDAPAPDGIPWPSLAHRAVGSAMWASGLPSSCPHRHCQSCRARRRASEQQWHATRSRS